MTDSIHLKQCVTLYLFALPLALANDLGWATVPIVTVIAFTFMGIEGIADEIEMPFGNDDRDLPLGKQCQCTVLMMSDFWKQTGTVMILKRKFCACPVLIHLHVCKG
jgi:predicted membrane chloride channel (bestrophin family)